MMSTRGLILMRAPLGVPAAAAALHRMYHALRPAGVGVVMRVTARNDGAELLVLDALAARHHMRGVLEHALSPARYADLRALYVEMIYSVCTVDADALAALQDSIVFDPSVQAYRYAACNVVWILDHAIKSF